MSLRLRRTPDHPKYAALLFTKGLFFCSNFLERAFSPVPRHAGVGRDPGRASSHNFQLSPHPMEEKEKEKEKEFFWFRLRRAA